MKRRTVPTSSPVLLLAALAAAALVLAACSDSGGGGLPGGGGDGGGSPDAAAGDVAGGDGATGSDAATPDGGAPDVAGCADCFAPATCVDGFCVNPAPGGCTPGVTDVCYGEGAIMTCDPTGTAFVPVDCPPNEGCLDNACKPVICVPGQVICEGLASTKACNDEGTGFLESQACPEGMFCTSGKCTDTCLSDPKFGSYVGCAYWTVDLPNWPDPTITPTTPEDLPHALVISNPNEVDAKVEFEAPPGVTVDAGDGVVKGGQSRVFLMPVVNTEGTGVGLKGIRFTSTRPILAHQFNPWKAIWSNDASLLLPESFLGKEYVVVSWPTDPRGLIQLPIPGLPPMENVNGFFTVAAPYDDTQVTIQVKGRVAAGPKVSAMAPGAVQTVTLQRGEILNIECEPQTIFEGCDLTGSTVDASRPVVVFAGHESAGIGSPYSAQDEGGCCLDHLEEQMLPIGVLDTTYLAVKSKPRGQDPDLWRVVAAQANVTLSTDPPIEGLNGKTLAKRGDWVEAYTEKSFELQATGKVQVAQYLIGQEPTTSGTGDPSLMLAVPAQRFREFYVLTVPPGYDTNWITVIRPAGATLSSAAGVIPDSAFQAFGSGAWEYAYLELPVGVHKIAGSARFGLIAYGYNGAMSYGYTGGMD